jgi:hypothetical protein
MRQPGRQAIEQRRASAVTRLMGYLSFWQALTYRKAPAKKITV